MLIQRVIMVGFHLPDEYDAMQNFILKNDMDQWKKHKHAQYTHFIKTEQSTVTVQEGEDNGTVD